MSTKKNYPPLYLYYNKETYLLLPAYYDYKSVEDFADKLAAKRIINPNLTHEFWLETALSKQGDPPRLITSDDILGNVLKEMGDKKLCCYPAEPYSSGSDDPYVFFDARKIDLDALISNPEFQVEEYLKRIPDYKKPDEKIMTELITLFQEIIPEPISEDIKTEEQLIKMLLNLPKTLSMSEKIKILIYAALEGNSEVKEISP